MHGTQHIKKQVINSFSYIKNLSVVVEKFFDEHSNHFDALKHLNAYYRQSTIRLVASNVCALGKPLISTVDDLDDSEV